MSMTGVLHRVLITLGTLALSITALAQEESAKALAELSWYSEEYPLYNYSGEDGIPAGIVVEILLKAFEQLNVDFAARDIQIVPWNRSCKYVQSKPGTALFSMTYTPERERIMRFVGPVIPTTVSVLAPKSKKLTVSKAADPNGLRVGTVRDDIGDQLVRSLALSDVILVRKNSLKQLIFLLVTGRVDAVAYEAHVFRHALSQSGDDPDVYDDVFVLKEGQLGYAFHRSTDPQLLAPLQFATMAKWITPAQALETKPRASTPASLGSSTEYPMPTLPHLPGIDTQRGLEIVQGNVDLYVKLLRKFRDREADFGARLIAARADDDPETATRCAHTLKGVAGNLGAARLQALATRLEAACQTGGSDDEVTLRLDDTVAELETVLGGLACLGGSPRKAMDSVEKAANLAPQLLQLRELLEDYDGGAGEIMESLEHHPALSGRRPLVARLVSAIEDYDFDLALQRLSQLEKELDLTAS